MHQPYLKNPLPVKINLIKNSKIPKVLGSDAIHAKENTNFGAKKFYLRKYGYNTHVNIQNYIYKNSAK